MTWIFNNSLWVWYPSLGTHYYFWQSGALAVESHQVFCAIVGEQFDCWVWIPKYFEYSNYFYFLLIVLNSCIYLFILFIFVYLFILFCLLFYFIYFILIANLFLFVFILSSNLFYFICFNFLKKKILCYSSESLSQRPIIIWSRDWNGS